MSDPGLLILASLAEGEKHGYAMMEDIERFAGSRLGPGTLYGWIRPVESTDRRRPYRLTASGRTHLLEEMTRADAVVQTALRRLKPV